MRRIILRMLLTTLSLVFVFAAILAIGRTAAHALVRAGAVAQGGTQVFVDDTDIGGVVTSAHGPEAGVGVIAETAELPTKFRKIVVTDDLGRYLIPDLPEAHYKLWVRGPVLVPTLCWCFSLPRRPGPQCACHTQWVFTRAI